MSTRSGKRIHASIDSPGVDTEIVTRSERKTRNKKQKENVELSVKKRHNYVSYPAEEDTAGVSSDVTETVEKVRRTGRFLRNTLKEQNFEEPVTNNTLLSDSHKSVRKSRRGKKFIEDVESAGDTENIQNEQTKAVATDKNKNKKKKNKKPSMESVNGEEEEKVVVKKKGIKKKKKSSKSFVVSTDGVEENETGKPNNISNISVDSFHSAAGSPIKSDLTEDDCQNHIKYKTVDELCTTLTETDNVTTVFNTTLGATSKNRKSKLKNTTIDKFEAEGDNENKLDSTFNRITKVTDDNTIDGARKKRRKSSIKNATFDKIESNDVNTDKINTTYDKTDGVPTELNTTVDALSRKNRKTSLKNSTFDKIDTMEADRANLNITFDKMEESTTDLNTIVDALSRKKKRTCLKNSTFEKIEPMEADEANLNATFDKMEESTTDFNTTIERKKSRTSLKNSTFDKIEPMEADEANLNATFDRMKESTTDFNTTIERKKSRSSLKNSTFDKIEPIEAERASLNTTFETIEENPTVFNTTVDLSTKKRRKSAVQSTLSAKYEKNEQDKNISSVTFDTNANVPIILNDKERTSKSKRNKSSVKKSTTDKMEIKANTTLSDFDCSNSTFEDTKSHGCLTNDKLTKNGNKFNSETKIAKSETSNDLDHSHINDSSSIRITADEDHKERRKSNVDKIGKDTDTSGSKETIITFHKDDRSLTNSTFHKESPQTNDVVQISNFNSESRGTPETKSLDSTYDKDDKRNTAFDSERSDISNDSKKSSLISSDATFNLTYDKSHDNSRISITSDESKTENILNYTPVLIESSIDESRTVEDKTPDKSSVPLTPLKRESTFNKDSSDTAMSPKPKSAEKTPARRKSSPGRTPHPSSKSSQKEKSMMNVTRSIEKPSLVDAGARQTRVMFCSPANNPAVVSQIKGRVIKSNLKGSNKSFVFDDSVSSEARAVRRKRSLTAGDDTRAKRSRLAGDAPRPPRTRALSAAVKLPEPLTPSKRAAPTPSGGGVSTAGARPARTRLPDFAALHRRQFARMESLDECQERRARRAKQLLTPTGCVAMLERISPKGNTPPTAAPAKETAGKLHTPSKPKLPTLESINPGYTRFGFRLNTDVNPFSVGKDTNKPQPNGILPTDPRPRTSEKEAKERRGTKPLPSLAGATGRREVARQAVMREKSFNDRRDVTRKETRTVIKGVRTNRRFELQMKMRNVNM